MKNFCSENNYWDIAELFSVSLNNAVDYRFDAKTLNLSTARYVEDYIWYESVDLWQCRSQDNTIVYSYPDEWDFSDEEGKILIEKGEDFAVVAVEPNKVYLPTAIRIPFPPENESE